MSYDPDDPNAVYLCEHEDLICPCGDVKCHQNSIVLAGLRRWPCNHEAQYTIQLFDGDAEADNAMSVCLSHLADELPEPVGLQHVKVYSTGA